MAVSVRIKLTMSLKAGRGNRTRTCDLMLPKHALYQTELYPGFKKVEIILYPRK